MKGLHLIAILLSTYFLFSCAVVSNVSLIGLSITYTISLSGMFQYVIRQSAEVENLVSKTSYCTDLTSYHCMDPLTG